MCRSTTQALHPLMPATGIGTTRLGPARKGIASEAYLRPGPQRAAPSSARQSCGSIETKAAPRKESCQRLPNRLSSAPDAAASTASCPASRDDREPPLSVGQDAYDYIPSTGNVKRNSWGDRLQSADIPWNRLAGAALTMRTRMKLMQNQSLPCPPQPAAQQPSPDFYRRSRPASKAGAAHEQGGLPCAIAS